MCLKIRYCSFLGKFLGTKQALRKACSSFAWFSTDSDFTSCSRPCTIQQPKQRGRVHKIFTPDCSGKFLNFYLQQSSYTCFQLTPKSWLELLQTAFRRRTRVKHGLIAKEHQQQNCLKPHVRHHPLRHSRPLMATGQHNKTYHPLTECYFQRGRSRARRSSRVLLTVTMDLTTLMMRLPSPRTCP
jgi:hypothetical protein